MALKQLQLLLYSNICDGVKFPTTTFLTKESTCTKFELLFVISYAETIIIYSLRDRFSTSIFDGLA